MYNRRGFLSVADYVLEGAAKQELHASLIYIEKLNFSRLVKEFGGLIEREILVNFVDTLKSAFRSSDVIARIGDDKFVVLTFHNQSLKIESVLMQLRKKMQLANDSQKNRFHTHYKIGSFSFAPEYFSSSGRLIDLVDKRMSESQYSESCSLENG